MAASQFFTATPADGGVRLRFRDQFAVELDDDGIARSKTDAAESGDELMGDIIHVFGPLLPNQSAALVEQDNGTIAVIVTSEPEDLIGNSTNSNAGIVGDKITKDRNLYRAETYRKGSEARKLAELNAINRRHFKR